MTQEHTYGKIPAYCIAKRGNFWSKKISKKKLRHSRENKILSSSVHAARAVLFAFENSNNFTSLGASSMSDFV